MFCRRKRIGKSINSIKRKSLHLQKDFLSKVINYINISSGKRWKVIIATKQFTSQTVVQTLIYLFTSAFIRVFLSYRKAKFQSYFGVSSWIKNNCLQMSFILMFSTELIQ